jgi:hypothetical protein
MRRSISALMLAGLAVGCAAPEPVLNQERSVSRASYGSGFIARFQELDGLDGLTRVSLRCAGLLAKAADRGRSGGASAASVQFAADGDTILRHLGRSGSRDAGLSLRQMETEIAAGRLYLEAQPDSEGRRQAIGTCLDLAREVADIARRRT